jgi:hypothetical protein
MYQTLHRTISMRHKAKGTRWTRLLAALTLVEIVAGGPISTAQAVNLVVNPLTGLDAVALDQRFYWSGAPPVFIDSIGTPGGGGPAFDPFYELTVPTNATVDSMALDGFVTGDVFELWADGAPVAWDNSFFDGSGYFHGEADDYFLSAGTHLFTIRVTSGLSGGGAWLSFSPVTVIPEPSMLALTAIALLGIVGRRRQKR